MPKIVIDGVSAELNSHTEGILLDNILEVISDFGIDTDLVKEVSIEDDE